MREKLIDIIEYYADFLDWDRKEDMVDSIMEKRFATDNNVGGWIPVTERLPDVVSTHKRYRSTYKSSDRVLAVCKQKSGKVMVKEGFVEFYNDFPEPIWRIPGSIDCVTHWMPLPEPPKGE